MQTLVAGMNLLARQDDPDIHLWTPKEQVKAILMERFRRRKEARHRDDLAAVLPAAKDDGNGTPLPAGL